MKTWLFSILTLLIFLNTGFGQYKISGFIADQDEIPFIGVEAILKGEGLKRNAISDTTGAFYFEDLPAGQYHLTVITGYGIINKSFDLQTSLIIQLQQSRAIATDAVVVHAVRAGRDAPVASSLLDEEEIDRRNLGQDVPFLLANTPNAFASSDAGTGIGYTGLRIRGSDPTRINVTINGVPLNDAESQGVFWVDLPDFASSAESIEIQRGVGTSSFGGGAFGASININTLESATDPYLRISGAAGSFNTLKGSAEFATGLVGKHLVANGRLSYIASDGFIDRASADLRSFYLSSAWLSRKSSIRLNVFSGKEVTYQAWYAVPAQYIDDPSLRTFNPAGMEKPGDPYDNEVDDYTQTHFQLLANKEITSQFHGFLTLHYTRGKGFYEQYKGVDFFESHFAEFLDDYGIGGADAIRRRWLDNHYYGAIGGLQFFDPSDKFEFQMAGALHRYLGDHYGEVVGSNAVDPIPELPYYYANDAAKTDGNLFAKLDYQIGARTRLYMDLQYRAVNYTFQGFDQDGLPADQEVRHRFWNPKLGLQMQLSDLQTAYAKVGIANKEPNRDDYVESSPLTRPSPERLYDFEVGYGYAGRSATLNAAVYAMLYRDQLVLTGQINDVGAYTRRNVGSSHRIGVELDGSLELGDRLQFNGNLALSSNKIETFVEYVDNWDYDPQGSEPAQFEIEHNQTDIAFSPSIIGAGSLEWLVVTTDKWKATASMIGKYVGKQYLDNTQSEDASLNPWLTTDFLVTAERRFRGVEIAFKLLVRNVFDEAFESNGWVYRFRSEGYDPRPDDPYAVLESAGSAQYLLKGYYPQAGRNVLAGLEFRF